MSVQSVSRYISDGFPHVEGWLSEHILRVVSHLGEEMNKCGVVGGACEIGVFKGKFIIGLAHAVDGRPSLAIDLFDKQLFNIDNSGGGHKDLLATFRTNVAKYGVPDAKLIDMGIDSFDLTFADQLDITKEFGRFQFFSIDGGHEPEHIINDYHFAEAVTHTGGAIIIDDIMNAGWPGVMEGVATLFVTGKPKFVPLALGHNKLILVGKSYHDIYLNAMMKRLRQEMPGKIFWEKKFFGHKIISVL